jgi:inhibitor of KinA sporulation pathway (predicted exonuclease)
MKYLVTDTEYTTWEGALESGWAGPGQHREIFQLGAVLTDSAFREIESVVILVRPKINPMLSDFAQRLTGVSQIQLEQYGISFPEALQKFAVLAAKASSIICMSGDSGVFRENCQLNQVAFPFAQDFHQLRPLLERQRVDLTQFSSGDLHKLTPTPLTGQTHDALHDCRSMATWLHHAKAQGIFVSVSDLPTEIPRGDPRSRSRPINP